MIERNTIHEADLFDLCAQLDAGSVDMILADLPYGTTACSWDTVIPFDPMWAAFRRIIKPRGAIVLTASQPFTSALVMSWPQGFKYVWTWNKKYHSNPFLSAIQPLRITEDVLVFSEQATNYYPQMNLRPSEWMRAVPSFANKNGAIFADKAQRHPNASTRREMFPTNVLNFPLDNPHARTTEHPTQKPVALFEYLIRTYTQPGELVFDPTAGSGTTAVAARQTGRDYIVGDSSAEYVAIMRERLGKPYTLPMMELEAASCHSMQL
jgi:site-specific DNA-methyltransferase (adenine-specific)